MDWFSFACPELIWLCFCSCCGNVTEEGAFDVMFDGLWRPASPVHLWMGTLRNVILIDVVIWPCTYKIIKPSSRLHRSFTCVQKLHVSHLLAVNNPSSENKEHTTMLLINGTHI